MYLTKAKAGVLHDDDYLWAGVLHVIGLQIDHVRSIPEQKRSFNFDQVQHLPGPFRPFSLMLSILMLLYRFLRRHRRISSGFGILESTGQALNDHLVSEVLTGRLGSFPTASNCSSSYCIAFIHFLLRYSTILRSSNGPDKHSETICDLIFWLGRLDYSLVL